MRRHNAILIMGCLAVLLLVGTADPAGAQVTTAAMRGTVADATGPVPGATVTVSNTASGFQYSSVTDGAGAFQFSGLAPGSYELRVSLSGYQEVAQVVQLLVGQVSTLKVELKQQQMFLENVTVVGEQTKLLIDTRSPSISTNITSQQIETLPQNNRNFLAFAGLAPGVQFTANNDARGQTFRSGGANPKQVNVYIDGLSYKNDIIQGGAFMQDSSRGNPFPQGAVQEYQVLTQNYAAEYEKAAAAVITAVTKSGGNQFHGDLLYLFQDKGMVAQDDFAAKRGDKKPPYKRNQYSLSLGGPIMKDRLHYFVSFEKSDRDVVSSVFRGGNWSQAPDNVKAILDKYPTGALSAPFSEKLYFGKLTWQPTVSQTMDASYHHRDESEVTDFGTQRVKDGARSFEIPTDAVTVRHLGVLGGSSFNEASLTYQKLGWKQIALKPGLPHMNYIGLLDIGAPDYTQDLSQKKTGIRDDFTYMVDWVGNHTVKSGVVVNWMKYNMTKRAFYNPYYEFRSAENWQFPFLARFGAGNPSLDFSNNEYGLFVQDTWRISPSFTVNAGVRWDYETDMLNNGYVTPANIVTAMKSACKDYGQPIGGKTRWCITDFFDLANYTSTGHNRSSYKGMVQPRLGFSWDVQGDGKTVVFGGWGKYYDRVTLNDIYDEQAKQYWKQYRFCFSAAGGDTAPNCGPAIKWDPSYLTPAGLSTLVSTGAVGPEVWMLANDTRPPYTNQWTLGVRHQLGSWLASLSYANSRGYNGLSWNFATLPPGTPFNDRWGAWIGIPGYGIILRSSDVRKTWYDGYFFTLDKPYTPDSKWGVNLAYTYGKAYQNGTLDEGVAFSFDYVSPNDYYKFPANTDERHHLVVSGTIGLPFGFTASSIITLGSGTPYTYTDCLAGWDKCVTHFNEGRPEKQSFLGLKQFAYRSVDLRLEWGTDVGAGMRLGLVGEAFNVFNFANDGCFDGWAGAPGSPNPNFGKPTCQFNTRRLQIGARFAF